MSTLDSITLANNTIRMGLLTQLQVNQAFADLNSRKVAPQEFLRCLERKGFLTPYQTTKLLKGETDGFFLGGYRILYKIASGSFGRVYRAVDASTGRIVAIKILRKKWSEDKRKIELFMREAKLGMTLRHPNIVEILAVDHEARTNQHFIVMEFVEGGNLRDLMTIRKKLQVADVLRLMEETASALTHASTHGITHRDIKLTNILLSSAGPAKLVDFGLAGEAVGAHAGEDKEEVAVDRTVDYAGLEKATGAPAGDPRSDLFFLGCVGYELLSGRSPLEKCRSQMTRISAQRFEKIVPLKASEVQAPASMLRLIENLMVLDPDRRIQTPSQLMERINEVWPEVGESLKRTQKAPAAKTKAAATIFLVERDEKLQDLLRTKLKAIGFRILIAADPIRALERFRQQPFELLVVDASTVGEIGYYVFQQILEDANRQNVACRGILMLSTDQTVWKERVEEYPNAVTLIQPIKYKQLLQAIQTQLDAAAAT